MPGHYVSRVWQHEPTRHAPAKYRRACKYDGFVPLKLADLSLSLEGTVAGLAAEAETAIRRLNQAADPALTPLARLLLRTESIASSKIEGIRTGVRELARAEARVEAGGNAGPTSMEVLASIDAMELALTEAAGAQRFELDHILRMHARLMERALNAARIAGQVRTSQNWIGGNDYNPCGADFVPPPPEDVADLLDDLCEAINDDRLPPVVQAALVHAQFETIHPFADGNGRAGRALIHVVLRRRAVAPAYVPPISVILGADRDRYVAGLIGYRETSVTPWVEQFAAATYRAARLAENYRERVEGLIDDWRTMLFSIPAAPRSDATAWAVIDILPGYPIITAPVAVAATGRSKPGVYEAIRQLEVAGVLKPLSASKRNRSWEAVGLLDLFEGLEAGMLPP